jgi:hypothetical protein
MSIFIQFILVVITIFLTFSVIISTVYISDYIRFKNFKKKYPDKVICFVCKYYSHLCQACCHSSNVRTEIDFHTGLERKYFITYHMNPDGLCKLFEYKVSVIYKILVFLEKLKFKK